MLEAASGLLGSTKTIVAAVVAGLVMTAGVGGDGAAISGGLDALGIGGDSGATVNATAPQDESQGASDVGIAFEGDRSTTTGAVSSGSTEAGSSAGSGAAAATQLSVSSTTTADAAASDGPERQADAVISGVLESVTQSVCGDATLSGSGDAAGNALLSTCTSADGPSASSGGSGSLEAGPLGIQLGANGAAESAN